MYLHVNTFLALGFFNNANANTDISEYRVASVTHKVRTHASLDAKRIGLIYAGDIFEVGPIVGYEDCAAGWASVLGGVVCLVKTEVVDAAPIDLPQLLQILPPKTEDEIQLHSVTPQDPPFMPVLFGKRDEKHDGRLWGSVSEYLDEKPHRWRLKEGKDYRFVDVHQTDQGWVLERPNGSVTPMSDVYVYPVSRFSGRDFEQFPQTSSSGVAWVSNPEGTTVYWNPSDEDATGLVLERRRILEISTEDTPDWVRIPMGEVDGYVRIADLTMWNSIDAPKGVSNETVWLDVDIDTQMLAVKQGDELLYLTLISSARKGHTTPLGTLQIYDKSVGWDLGSREGAEEPYYMEKVPFVMHYYPRYAIHSAFWHDDFGERASHGCINISPQDAWQVYQRVTPVMPSGWQYVKQTEKNAGTIVRIRDGEEIGRTKRIKP